MRIRLIVLLAGGLVCTAATAWGQPPDRSERPASGSGGVDAFVERMMKFDKNGDGKLTKDEITDERLQSLFERADANHDGVLTADELKEFYATKQSAGGGRRGSGRGGPDGATADDGPRAQRRGPGNDGSPDNAPPGDAPRVPRRGQPGGDGPDGPGGPGPDDPSGPGDGPGRRPGPGGSGGFGGPPQPGQILPDRLQEMLKLTDEQKKQVADLQKDVDAKLAKILTEDQQKQLKEMRNRRPPRRGDNGPGPDGPGPGGPGRPDAGQGRGGPEGAPDRPRGRGANPRESIQEQF